MPRTPTWRTSLVGYASQMIAQWAARAPRAKRMPELVIHVEHRLHYNPEMKSVFLFVPGVHHHRADARDRHAHLHQHRARKGVRKHGSDARVPAAPGVIIAREGRALPAALPGQRHVRAHRGRALLFHVPMEGSYLLLVLEGCSSSSPRSSLGLLISTMADPADRADALALRADDAHHPAQRLHLPTSAACRGPCIVSQQCDARQALHHHPARHHAQRQRDRTCFGRPRWYWPA
jgi:hypothetical protein